jgi:hypothetical protein
MGTGRTYGMTRLFLWVACLVVGAVGCGAQSGSQRGPEIDVRRAAVVSGQAPELLLAGPGWLLHVNHERRGHVTIYRVARRAGTAADCGSVGADPSAVAEAVDTLGRVTLYVRAGEVACARASRSVRLSWHAQPLAAPDLTREALASLQ